MELDDDVCDRARLARDARFDGQFFIAVRSTRVYCRPICPSRTARRENVRYFRTAEEAVTAGYRPCLRCRPETAPGTPAWNGTSATVARALRLMTEGEMPEWSIGALSRRLGISPRHLDRLFQLHLGASPIAIAKTWRVHFAKELISDTDLPMFRVAAASGFRSVRRFNSSIHETYGRTPSELRGRGRVTAAAAADEYVFRLPYRPPYDWDSFLAFLAVRATPGVEEVVNGTYRRTFALRGRHGILEIRHVDSARALEARVRFPEPASLLPIVLRLRGMFDVGADPRAIAEHLRADPLLRPLVARHPGLRVPGAWDGFELAVRAVLGQQVSVAAASTLAGRIARAHGEPLTIPDSGGLTVVFPTPRALAAATLTGMPRTRAAAISALAAAADSGRLTFSDSDPEVLAGLSAIRGIGEWTAQYVAMRALRQPDAFPADDLVLLRMAGGGDATTAAALIKRAEPWRPWRAYAAIHLWRAAGDPAAESRRHAGSTSRARPAASVSIPRSAESR